jgi:hypothetical protein
VVRNITEGAKVKVQEVTEALEPDLLYPLLRGRDVQRWKAEPSVAIILVHKKDGSIISEPELQGRFPRIYGYLKHFEAVLRRRRDAMVQGMYRRGLPFYSFSAVGTYTFAPWKVVWLGFGAREIKAAVIGQVDCKPVMTNQAMHPFVSLEREEEAHFLCACLNSSIFDFAVKSHTQLGGKSFAQANILERIRIPRFDPSDPVHCRLAELSEAAHAAAARDDARTLHELEAEIDHQAARLWGLSDAELREIQHSLAELEGEEPS